MSISLAPSFGIGWQGFTSSGIPLNSGLLYTYQANSTTPQATYTTSAGNVANSNPIQLGVDGRPASEIWLTDGVAYRFDLYDALSNLIKSYDNIVGNANAAFPASLAASGGSALVGFLQAGTGAIARTLQSKERETVSITDFGASTALADNSAFIQTAMDAVSAAGGGDLLVPNGTFICKSRDYINSASATIGRCCVILKDNVTLRGESWNATLKLDANQYIAGTYFRMIASDTVNLLQKAAIRDLTIDGNRANNPAITDGSNILLECGAQVTIENVRSVNSQGNGIMLRATTTTAMKDIKVLGCHVENHSMIGIECAQFDGLVIAGNTVRTTGNNAIDIYGDNGTPGGNSHGRNFAIVGNSCIDSVVNTGIFLETVRDGTVSGNAVKNCANGIMANTANNVRRNIVISGNSIVDTVNGIYSSGATEGETITGNTLNNFSQFGIALGGATHVDVHHNMLTPATNTTICIRNEGAGNAYNRIYDNIVNSSGITAAYLLSDGATGTTDNFFGAFKVMPAQVGPDQVGRECRAQTQSYAVATGPFTYTPPNNTAGRIMVTLRNGTSGNFEMQAVPYCKSAGTLKIGTVVEKAQTAGAAIASIAISGADIVITAALADFANVCEVGVVDVKMA